MSLPPRSETRDGGPPPHLGNDVVDLLDPRTRASHDNPRFLSRVLADEERLWIEKAPEPRRELWAHWAAKEAAYKFFSKLLGVPPVFEHAAFIVSWNDEGEGGRSGLVRFRDREVPVHVVWRESWVHALASPRIEDAAVDYRVEPFSGKTLEQLLPALTPAEADAVHSAASAAVRLGARRHAAERFGVEERRLQIVCAPGVTGRRPPRLVLDGAPAPGDVSLSHHGRLIAWAILVQKPDGR